MSREYEHPPLIEAMCGFRFPPGQEWDATVPGLVYERLQDHYPNKRSGKHVNVSVGIEGGDFRPSFGAEERTIFISEDEKDIVQMKPGELTVHRLEPYPSWEQFRPEVLRVLEAYLDVATPEVFHRVRMRYLNQIDFSKPLDLADYFDFYPHVGEQLPEEHGPFICGAEFPVAESELLRMEMTSVEPESDGTEASVRLDLTFNRQSQISVSDFEREQWLNSAHEEIEEAFEGAIRDGLREKFGWKEAQ
jgi:uncharacterized protein (TIGR04255 family)